MQISDCPHESIVTLCSNVPGRCETGYMVMRANRNVKTACVTLIPVVRHGSWQFDYTSRIIPVCEETKCFMIKE